MLFAKKINFIISICATILLSSPALYSAGLENSTSSSKAHNDTLTNSLLIFLLDNYEKTYDLVTSDLITALIQKSSPILASATLIKHIKDSTAGKFLPTENLSALNIYSIINEANPSYTQKLRSKNTIIYLSDLKNSINQNWIIKEVNEFLYLLLPKSYLTERGISVEDVNKVLNKEDPITETEQILSFKVNHLKTVTLESTQNPEEHDSIDYFVPSLKNIFLTRNEYVNAGAIAPKLAMYIVGHGLTNYMICGLSIQNFKDFLQFLEKLNMSVLVYNSCYAGGTNIELVYKDSAANVNRTYDFTIINKSITDVESKGFYLYTRLNNEKIEIKPYYNFKCFIEKLNNPTTVNFIDALECLSPLTFASNIPQIRYPGLPWFSILDTKNVAGISQVMAKTRTEPLNISTYFKKEGKSAAPLAILLYANAIPFELIVDTKKENSDTCYAPTFTSMVTGDAKHHLKKITSTCNSTHDILHSFIIKDLLHRKVFLIDEISAVNPETRSDQKTLKDVIIDITPDTSAKIYYTFDDNVYHSVGDSHDIPGTDEHKKEYRMLLDNFKSEDVSQQPPAQFKKIDRKEIGLKYTLLEELTKNAHTEFNSIINSDIAKQKILKILNDMPNDSVLGIPGIFGNECSIENPACWYNLINDLTKNITEKDHKIIWFNQLILYDSVNWGYLVFKDIIIEVKPYETNIFYTDLSPSSPGKYKISRKKGEADMPYRQTKLIEDYVPTFVDLFNHAFKYYTLDTSIELATEAKPIHQQLTPERIAQMKMVLEKKYLNLKNANK